MFAGWLIASNGLRLSARWAAVLSVALTTLACSKEESPAESVPPEFDDLTLSAVRGLELYSRSGCVVCHCTNARGECNLDAPNIQSAPLSRIAGYILVGPPVHPLKQQMDDQELVDLAAFLDGLDATEPLARSSRLARGYNLYAGRDGCIECHLSPPDGINQALLGPVLTNCSAGDGSCTSAGTPAPDTIYRVLSGANPCHPVQRNPPEELPCECDGREIKTTTAVRLLTDMPYPEQDEDRVQLSFFLSVLAPPPQSLADPCAAADDPEACEFDSKFVHVHDGVEAMFVPADEANAGGSAGSCGDAGVEPPESGDAG